MAGQSLPPQYNVDENTKNLLLEKAKRRAELREEFLKLKSDPFRHASEEGGYVVCFFLVLCHSKGYFIFTSVWYCHIFDNDYYFVHFTEDEWTSLTISSEQRKHNN